MHEMDSEMSAEMKHMDCQDIGALLSALVDDQVDAATRHRAERHLAGCASCRARLDQAERLDAALSEQNGTMHGGGAALPAGFEAAVLERARADQRNWRQTMMTWTGWVAAAACLMLAIMIWAFDRNMWINQNAPMAMGDGLPADTAPPDADQSASEPIVRTAGYQRRSWTFDGELPGELLPEFSAARKSDDETTLQPTLGDPAEGLLDPAFEQSRSVDHEPAAAGEAGEISRAAAALNDGNSNLTRDDAQTLHSVSLLLELLESADQSSFAEIERIRQIVEYDNLLTRLQSLRDRLRPEDRPVVLAAEGLLLRIARGPVTQEDVHVLGTDAAKLELASRLQAISTRRYSSHSL